jgi:hypothetical protein
MIFLVPWLLDLLPGRLGSGMGLASYRRATLKRVLLRRRPPPRPLAPLAPLFHAPASGIMFVPHIMPPAPVPASAGQGRASGTRFGEFVAGWFALPPVSPGLKWNLFDSRPLFHLTPLPPRRLWPIQTLSQSPPPKAKARKLCNAACRAGASEKEGRGGRSGLEVSAGRSIVWARSGAQRGLQDLRQRRAHGARLGWFAAACRCLRTKPPAQRVHVARKRSSFAATLPPGRQKGKGAGWRQEDRVPRPQEA